MQLVYVRLMNATGANCHYIISMENRCNLYAPALPTKEKLLNVNTILAPTGPLHQAFSRFALNLKFGKGVSCLTEVNMELRKPFAQLHLKGFYNHIKM
jgi:hypothetical protein